MLQVIKAGLNDLPVIEQLAHATWPDAYGKILSPEQLSYMLKLIYSNSSLANQVENLQHHFIIVKENEEAVGFASYSPKQQNNKKVFRLHKLYVLPNQQGKGTGKFLLNFIITEIKESGAEILELNVNRHNKAFYFYRKNGFTISREEDIDIGSGYFMNDYVMEKPL
ncbi:MAG: GNAT family N-acetyltransferase [Ferruginibacter sp.]